jgi:hypothetical protein
MMKRLILIITIATCSGCGVLLPDVMVVGTEQGIRAYNDGQSALIAQAKTTHKTGETPYWSNRRVQSQYSFWDRLSKGFVNTVEAPNAE